jgi:3-hydroxymyristoyl/3-hydroxydecanoyl-(acyl carrier protein) dehydratase
MHKSQDPSAELPPGVVVQAMPRAPAGAPDPPSTPQPAPRQATGAQAMAEHHDRMSAVHEHFLRLQEQVHGDFLAHRLRLLEGLRGPRSLATTLAEDAPTALFPAAADAPEDNRLSISTEVTWDDWFLDAHVVPAGLLLEPIGPLVAQAAGPTFGLVECEVEFVDVLPRPGDTVVTDLRLSGGVFQIAASVCDKSIVHVRGRCSPPEESLPAPARMAALAGLTASTGSQTSSTKTQFLERDLAALFDGDAFACFGKGFERSASHTRTPPLPGGRLIRLASVRGLEPTGGRWSKGSLRARVEPAVEELPPSSDPGLRLARLYQGALQVLAFFAMAKGGTLERDGWRFEPIQGQAARLRFMAAPTADSPLEFELAVEHFEVGRDATVIGDVSAWAGDTLVFQGEQMGLRLVPDWPLTSNRALQADGIAVDAGPGRAVTIDGFRIGYSSLLAGALGRPSEASQGPYPAFETGERQMPRLPGPPYHFITRVTAVTGERLSMRPGAAATMEYDVPVDAWYFDENGNRTMPFCILLEAALQPCGWLSVYVGCPLTTTEDVFFRNLDGNAMTVTGEVFPDSGTLRTQTAVTSVTRVSGVILLSYRIECFLGDRRICQLNAMFGYFPKEALALQVGLPTTEEQKAKLVAESPVRVDFAERPARYFEGPLRLPGPILLMIDRVTGFWPQGGAAGKGHLRAEKDVDPHAWFFRAHFYSDPVQPGSLGLEMMLQLLQFFAVDQGLGDGIEQPYFEPLALAAPVSWKFRGQVRPENGHIVTDVEIVSVDSGPDGVTILANGSLWVDGVRCYEAKNIGTRIRRGRHVSTLPPRVKETVLDPAVDRWVTDHRPSYTVPVMPGMSMVDRLAAAALEHVRDVYPRFEGTPEWFVVEVHDVRHHGWLVCDAPKRLRTEVKLLGARAVHRVDEAEVAATMHEVTDGAAAPRRVTVGRIRLARRFAEPPRAWPPLADAVPAASPYESASIFWGPRLQLLRRLALGAHGASAELDAAGADAPIGAVHPILLDGTLHAIPHDELERWSEKVPPGLMGVPVRLAARFFGPPPTRGKMRTEIRFIGFDGAVAFPTFAIQIIDPQGRVWASLRHVEMLVPVGHRKLSKEVRIPFLVQRRFHEGVGLAEFYPDRTELHAADVKRLDALPGSVAHVYELERDGAALDHRVIAIKDHVGQRARVHPGRVQVNASLSEGRCDELPLTRFPVSVEDREGVVVVRDAGPPTIDIADPTGHVRGARIRGVRVADPSAMKSARAIFIVQTTDLGAAALLPSLLSAMGGAPAQLVSAGATAPSSDARSVAKSEAKTVAAAVDEARALLERGTSTVFLIHEIEGFKMADLRAPLADLATASGAVLLPVGTHALDDGTEIWIGASIPPDDLRVLDHL